MRIKDSGDKVTTSESFEKTSFKIKASAKAFDILSSRLYTNVPLAIVRELSTNAWDAHVAGKNTEKSFHVHIPTIIEPYFKIRDFGTGLSKKDVFNLYTTYFDSDKTDSNDFTGALGLGSKSPFAYGKSFSVTSYYKGTKYIYSMHKDAKGLPMVSLMDETKTKEADGLEVQLAVKREDCKAFQESAEELYKYFPLKPTLSGAPIKLDTYEVFLEGEGWKLFKLKTDYYDHYRYKNMVRNAVAVMGNIGYPIKAEFFRGSPSNVLVKVPIFMDFDIGDLEMAANREELHYDDQTIAVINDRFKKVEAGIIGSIQEKIQEAKSLWKARCIVREFTSNNSDATISALFPITSKATFTWKEKPFTTENISVSGAGGKVRKLYMKRLSYYNKWTVTERRDVYRITPNPDAIIVIDDMKVGAITRAKKYLQDITQTGKDSNGRKKFEIYLFRPGKLDSTVDFQDLLGLGKEDVVRASTLKAPPKVHNSYRKKYKSNSPKSKVLLFKGKEDLTGQASFFWEDTEVDATEGGIYVPLKRFKVDTDLMEWYKGLPEDPEAIVSLLTNFKHLGVKTPMLIGIRTAAVEKVTKAGEWKDLFTFIEEKWVEVSKEDDLQQKASLSKSISTLRTSPKWYENIKDHIKRKESKSETFYKFATKVAVAAATDKRRDSFLKLAKSMGKAIEEQNIRLEEKHIWEAYPVIGLHASPYIWSTNKEQDKILAGYVELVDRAG